MNCENVHLACWRWLKAYYRRQDLAEERDCWDLQREVVKQKSLRSKRLHSIPEVAEEEPDGVDGLGQRLCFEDSGRPGTPHAQRHIYQQDPNMHNHLSPGKNTHHLQRQRSYPRFHDSRYGYATEERSLGRPNRQNTKSPDSGLDCGSEEEGSLGWGHRGYYTHGSPMRGPVRIIHCEGPVERRALAMGRKRTLTRQCSVEEDFCDMPMSVAKSVHTGDLRNREHFGPFREGGSQTFSREGALSEGRLDELDRVYYSPHREARAQSMARLNWDQPLVCVIQTFCRTFHHQAATILFFLMWSFFILYGCLRLLISSFFYIQYSSKLPHVHGCSCVFLFYFMCSSTFARS